MSEFKFDKLKNYEAPDEWAERVIKTANSKKKEKIYFTRGYRVAIICVCLILMCVMGFTVCLQVLDEAIIVPVNVEETVDSTKTPHMDNINVNIPNKNGEDFEEETKTDATEIDKEKETQATEPNKKETTNVEPTKKKPEKETQKVDKVKPTKKPQSPEQNDKEPQKPSQKPESTTPYVEPTETPIENKVVCTTTIGKNMISSSDAIYCRIYDCDDDVYLGDENIYSSQHLAQIYGSSEDNYYIRYFPVKRSVITKNGEYIVMFYDENGENLKTFGFTVNDF